MNSLSLVDVSAIYLGNGAASFSCSTDKDGSIDSSRSSSKSFGLVADTKIHLTSKKEWNPHKVMMSEVMVSSVSATRPNYLDDDLLESMDPSLLGLKEKLAALVQSIFQKWKGTMTR